MINKNELIFVNKILSAELSVRKAAKQLGLRRDDLISRIKNVLCGDEENLKKLELILIINKILFDNMKIEDAAESLKITTRELDNRILKLLVNNKDKKRRYEIYIKLNQNKRLSLHAE